MPLNRHSALPPAAPLPESLAELSALAGATAHSAADLRLLRDGAAAFPAMLEMIEGARERVRFENFIFAGDATGRRFADALSAAARRGVDVRVLYDPIGTMMVRGGSAARWLARSSGVNLRAFRPFTPLSPWSWGRLRHRDHRKTLAVDGARGVVGGLCISDHWAPSSRGGGGWRDTALCVGGPIVLDLESAFDAMWRRALARPAPRAIARSEVTHPPLAMVAADEPGLRRVAAIYRWLARRATHSLEITDAYMVAGRSLLSELTHAAHRGVEVRVLLPGRNNHPFAGAAARRVYAPLLAAGVGIWEWDGIMLHAKTVVVDGEVALVGSSNLDPLSLRRNYELNLLVADPVTGGAMREMFAADIAQATRVDPAAWARRPLWHRAFEAAAGFLSPNL